MVKIYSSEEFLFYCTSIFVEPNNEPSTSASNAGESESNSQKEQPDKGTTGSCDRNDNRLVPHVNEESISEPFIVLNHELIKSLHCSGNSTLNKDVDGNASSCIIEIQQVWFNFAAPPRTPITRKIDYTR